MLPPADAWNAHATRPRHRAAMTDVLFLPGIIAPAKSRYAPLLAELPGVQCVLKDLEVYRDSAPPEDYSITIAIDGSTAPPTRRASTGSISTDTPVAERSPWPTSRHARTGCSASPSTSRPWTSRTRATGPTGGTGSTTR